MRVVRRLRSPALVLAALALAACGEEALRAPDPVAQEAEPSLPLRGSVVVRRGKDAPAPADAPEVPRWQPRVLAPDEYELRERVDLSARISKHAVRVNGTLRLQERDRRAVLEVSLSPLLEGNAHRGVSRHAAEGTWRRVGDEILVEGLDLVIDEIPVLGPRGAVRRWRVETEDGLVVLRADPFVFQRPLAR
jgi:hypothetical protein